MKLVCALALMASFLALAEESKSLLKPTNKVESWRFEQHEGGTGSLKADGDAIAFTVTEADGTDWHVQAVQTGLDLKAGNEYVVKFQIKASESRSVGLHGNIDQEDWHSIGLHETVFASTEFKPHEFTFTASDVAPNGKNRISFVLGEGKGTVWVKDLTLTAK